jgi:predicted transcriptional regulator
MSTMTIRLPKELKARIAKAAERAGKTPHSLILEAIDEKAEREEQRADFDAEADARFERMVDSGKSIPWREMRQYLLRRLAGGAASRPVAKKMATSLVSVGKGERH